MNTDTVETLLTCLKDSINIRRAYVYKCNNNFTEEGH